MKYERYEILKPFSTFLPVIIDSECFIHIIKKKVKIKFVRLFLQKFKINKTAPVMGPICILIHKPQQIITTLLILDIYKNDTTWLIFFSPVRKHLSNIAKIDLSLFKQ